MIFYCSCSYLRIAIAAAVAVCTYAGNGFAQTEVSFRLHELDANSEFSAATAFDVNGDGKTDIISGAYWYQAPEWKQHKFREVTQIRGRYDDYSNLALDVDKDGDLDIVSVNYRSKSLYWCKNPGKNSNRGPLELWEQIVIDEPGSSETGRLVDINGDGQLDVLPNGTTFAAWYEITGTEIPAAIADPKASNNSSNQGVQWTRHELPKELIGHGIGAGDINGDGHFDIVGTTGWAEASNNQQADRWRWHPEFKLAKDSGLPILVHDVDGDSDADLIWSRGHNVGIYWSEQISESETSLSYSEDLNLGELDSLLAQRKWITHAIDTSWSCAHTLMLADINNDDSQDLVAGKRFQGHDGKDPGENDPLVVFWYEFDGDSRTWRQHSIPTGGKCGIDLDSTCVDIDDDGDVDILAPARCGLYWIENLLIGDSDKSSSTSVSGEVPGSSADHSNLMTFAAGKKNLPVRSALDFGSRRAQIRLGMQAVMGNLPQSHRRSPLEIQVLSVEQQDNYARIKLTYQSEAGDHVPAYLLVPDKVAKPAAAMLCLHPTQFELGKSQVCGLDGNPSRFYAHELAKRGFVCLAPDYPGFGDYRPFDFGAFSNRYASGSMKAIWNNIRAVDLLESLPCVNRDQIGVIGHSLGGHNALFTAAFDGRLRCVVSSCGFTAFADYYSGNLEGWTSDRYMPRIKTHFDSQPAKLPFDFPEVLGAIAPRPVFVNAPLNDHNFAVTGVRKCEAAVAPVYQLHDRKTSAEFVYPDAQHDFPDAIREQAYLWLEDILR